MNEKATELPWCERVPMLSINPHAATIDDIARLASELIDTKHALWEILEATENVTREDLRAAIRDIAR